MPRKLSMSRLIRQLILVVPSVLNLAGNMRALLEYEARLASKTMVTLIVLAFFSAILLSATWMCLLYMLFLYLISIPLNVFLALGILVLLNIILLIFILLKMTKAHRILFFPRIRNLIRQCFK